jgi:leucyl aminopeptidase
MKLESHIIQFNLGKNNSPFYYDIHFLYKSDENSEILKGYKTQWDAGVFKAEPKQILKDESSRKIFIGLGERGKLPLRNIVNLFFDFGKKLGKGEGLGYAIHLRKELLEDYSPNQLTYQIANTLEQGALDLQLLSSKKKEKKKAALVSFQTEDSKFDKEVLSGIRKSEIVVRHINGARVIAHLPANHFTPEEFVSRSKEIAKEKKLKVTVFDESKLKKMGMNGILTVSQGSDKKPKMVIIDYNPAGAKKTLALVGKGLTFDAGGISLKPPGDMHEMKYDMCGAAAAIHAIGAIAGVSPKIRVVAAIGVAENMPDAQAVKPGDVYTAYNGVTVEVQNTDAEGRLVLGDVLSYVSEKIKPDYLVDLATLTGAAIIALGHEAAALMSNNSELSAKIKEASDLSQDRIWELPLWEEYGEDLKSDIADLKNITGGRGAGTISGAMFLSHFVNQEIPWAHIDIAGAAWRKKSSGTQSNGPTGYGVRLLVELAEILAKT